MAKNKLKLTKTSHVNFNDMVAIVEKKYGFNIRDYHNFKFKVECMFKHNIKHERDWKFKNIPCLKLYYDDKNGDFNKAGRDFYATSKGKLAFESADAAYRLAPDGKCKEIPYMDFWHFIVDDVFYGEIYNGSMKTLNWVEAKKLAKEGWQKEICNCFIKEFGNKDYNVLFDW